MTDVAMRMLPGPDISLCRDLSTVAPQSSRRCVQSVYLLTSPDQPVSLLSQSRGPHQAASSHGGGGAQGQGDPVQMAHPGPFLPVVFRRQDCHPLDLQRLEAARAGPCSQSTDSRLLTCEEDYRPGNRLVQKDCNTRKPLATVSWPQKVSGGGFQSSMCAQAAGSLLAKSAELLGWCARRVKVQDVFMVYY